ncbi:hypothetical protein GGI25_002304 [Coemansia spiralis]|uniref:ABC transporter domain-containing protein n=2 Tax=Coemansia TaxID=4863 RepID=A0A9W8G943_9FUNG|nr:hypothetical protein EDC05_001129 [Coemansia umbellata]KAJ2678510.1 hypothetical protein GGI25_002304 [Coemansia spiralis]
MDALGFIRANAGVILDSLVSLASILGLIHPEFSNKTASLQLTTVFVCVANILITTFPLFQSDSQNVLNVTVVSMPTSSKLSAEHTAATAATASLLIYYLLSRGNFNSNAFAFMNTIRVSRLGLWSLFLPLPITAISAIFHCYLSWSFISAVIKASIEYHIKGMFGVKGFSIVRLNRKRKLTIEDLSDPDMEEKQLQKTRKLKLDTSKRFFVARLILLAEWKSLLFVLAGNMLTKLATHFRRLAFISILASLNNTSDSQSLSIVVISLLIWQLFGLSTIAEKYMSYQEKLLTRRLSGLIMEKVLKIYMTKHGELFDLMHMTRRTYHISNGAFSFVNALGRLIAEVFNIWIIASIIGWRFVIPIAISITHHILSQLVSHRIETLRKEHKVAKKPDFRKSLFPMYQNIRSIKFFAWENAFRGVLAWFEEDEYQPPIFWRFAENIFNVAGSATSQVAVVITINSYLGVADSPVYTDVALLMDSIGSLSEFTAVATTASEKVVQIRQKAAFIDKLVEPTKERYIDRPLDKREVVVELENCSFSWGTGKFCVAPTTLKIKDNELVMIVGRVGSGKSSFITALCGEMPIESGNGQVRGRIGYVEQKPNILDGTLRENILMGQEFDEKFFEQIIEACDMVKDIQSMPDGDLTNVGANGMKLSGGQKTRVALARALYLRADIYIFDDLLSAVDAHVEKHLVKHVLSNDGIIGNKARILVTHAEHLLPLGNRIIRFVDGHAEIIEQTPIVIVNTEPSINNENEESKESLNTNDVPPIHENKSPLSSSKMDYGKLPFKWSYFWRYIELSRFWRVAVVFAIHFANTYLLHYVEGLRLRLIVDNNPETIVSSLKQYLKINALIAIASRQLTSLEAWSRHLLWSKPLAEALRVEVINALLHVPLTQIEDMDRYEIMSLFMGKRYYTSHVVPEDLCSHIVHKSLMITSTVVQMFYISPLLLLVTLPVAAIAIGAKIYYKDVSSKASFLERTHYEGPSMTIAADLLYRRSLLRILGITDRFTNKLSAINARWNSISIATKAIDLSRALIGTVYREMVRTTVLVLKLWQHFYTQRSVLAGEIDAITTLALQLVQHIDTLISVDGSMSNSAEMVKLLFAYLELLPQEAPVIIEKHRPKQSWPEKGHIEFQNYSMRYRPELDLVLNDMSFSVCDNEKIGIVGRTGAGKSSISQALMRLVEPADGKIMIDNVDIASIGLFDLRARISIIPQDPALFIGTIRDNLDPLHQYSDDEIWGAVQAAQIGDLLETPSGKYIKPSTHDDMPVEDEDMGPWIEGIGLNKWVEFNGNNFSVGQRQLISLCRALLWRRKILLLDEATANVDSKTDQIMQTVIRREFRDCTILTIAHRLGTIMDSDRILVIDAGKVVEFDTPSNLLTSGRHFAQLVKSMEQNQKQ